MGEIIKGAAIGLGVVAAVGAGIHFYQKHKEEERAKADYNYIVRRQINAMVMGLKKDMENLNGANA